MHNFHYSSGGGNVEIIVSNYPPGSEHALVEFLKRKSKRQWEPLQTQPLDDGLHLLVQDMNTATAVTRLNGFQFMQNNLSVIVLGDTPTNAPTQHGHQSNRQSAPVSSLDSLSQFLQQRWSADQRFLNLEKMGLDPLYKRLMHSSSNDFRPALFKLASETFGDVTTVSLTSNRLRNLQPIAALAEYLPNILNLSLQDNNITNFTDLEPLAGKFNHLNELVLDGNPIKAREVERHGNDITYRSEVTRRFPTLKLLDGVPVAQAIQFDIQAADLEATAKQVQLPARVKGSFFDQDSSRMAANDFLGAFFQTFDGNRSALFNLYDDTALFSVSVSATFNASKSRNKGGAFNQGHHNQGPPSDWRDISRNLTRNKSLKRRVECLYYGSSAIVQLISTMPPTVHDLSRADNFVTDAWQMNGFSGYPAVLFIKVHGEFREGTAPNSAKYSFDRVFIVGPAGPGSKAQSAGWQYVILSDQWHIRNYSGNKAFQPEPEHQAAPAFGAVQQAPSSFSQPPQQQHIPQQSFGQPQHVSPAQPHAQTFGHQSSFAQPTPPPQQQHASFAAPPIQQQHQSFSPAPSSYTPPIQPVSQPFTPPSAQPTPPPPVAPPSTPQASTPVPPSAERPPGLTDQQHMQVMELKQRSGLNYNFALQCLAENDWNSANAMDSYERLKNINAIPPEAYGA